MLYRANVVYRFSLAAVLLGLGSLAIAQESDGQAKPAPAAATQPVTRPTTAPAATAEILSLQVTRPLGTEWSKAMNGVRRPSSYSGGSNAQNGMELLVAVRLPDREILTAGEDALAITTFVDEKHNDYGRGRREPRPGYSSGYSNQPNISEDGHGALFAISSDRVPAADASRILIRGTATFRTSIGRKTSERKTVPLRVGRTIELEPFPLSIKSISEVGSTTNRSLQVSMTAEGSIERLVEVKFYSNGKDLGARLTQRYDPTLQGNNAPRSQSNLTYSLPKLVEDIEVELVYVEGVENVIVPIEIQADLGQVKTAPATTAPAEAVPAAPRVNRADRSPPPGIPSPVVAGGNPSGATRPAWPPHQRVEFPSRPATQPFVESFAATRPAFPTPPAVAEGNAATRPTAVGLSSELVSVAINQEPTEKILAQWTPRQNLLFRRGWGTVLRFVVSSKDRTILEVNPLSLRIDRFVDDTGKDLSTESVTGADPRTGYSSESLWPNFSRDGRHAVLSVAMTDAPTRGATRIAVRGSVNLRLGSDEKVAEEKDVAIAIGTTLKAGRSAITIKGINSPANEGVELPTASTAQIMLSLSSKENPEYIRSIEFFEPDGTEIHATLQRPIGQSWRNPEYKPAEYNFQCRLARDVQKATVKITYFDRVEDKTVPLEMMGGIGL